jgi:hypothetical protein
MKYNLIFNPDLLFNLGILREDGKTKCLQLEIGAKAN